jgi:inositol 1,4,5-triphosphate receptor type 3
MEDYDALKRIMGKEEVMNVRLLENRIGHPVLYGEAIQLLHMRSGKMLTVSREETAKTEPENFRIYLSEERTPNSWFKMSPAAAIDSDGDLIGNLSDVILAPLLFAEEAVHVSAVPMGKQEQRRRSVIACDLLSTNVQMNAAAPEVREVNASFEDSVLRIALFTEVQKVDCLGCGDFVYLEDAEHTSCLRPLSAEEQRALPQAHSSVVGGADRDFLEKMKDEVVFAPVDHEFEHSSAIWVVERPTKQIGGPIIWNETYTLRHLKTGKFLSYFGNSGDGGGGGGGEAAAGAFVLSQTDQLPEAGLAAESAALRFAPASASTLRKTGDQELLHDRCATLLECRGTYAAKHDPHTVYLGGARFVRGRMVAESDGGLALVLRRVAPEGTKHPVLVGLTARHPMMALVDDLRRVPHGAGFDCETVADIAEQLCRFVVLDNIQDPTFATKLTHSIKTLPKRQHLLREQDCASVILDILHAQRQLVLGGDLRATRGEQKAESAWSALTEKALLLLRLIIIRNVPNQLVVAEQMPVLLSYVGTRHSSQAILVITELLGNREVQEQWVGLAEVHVCMEMLRSTPLNATALGVLEQLCECSGKVVESNQQLLVDHFLSREIGQTRSGDDTAELLPPIDDQTRAVVPAGGTEHAAISVYDGPSARARPKAGLLVSISPRSDGSFEFRFPGDTQARSLASLSEAETRFLAAQINLYAAVCAERMYIAIELLAPIMPFRNTSAQLVASFPGDVRPSVELRSAYMRAMTALYVDAAPQIANVGTDLTFVWSQVVAPDAMQMPCPDPSKADEFRPLQEMIGEELALVQMNTYTSNALGLLWKLLDFHFYNADFQMLQSAVGDLVRAIKMQLSDDDVNGTEVDTNKVLKSLGVCRKIRNRLGETVLDRKWVIRLLDSIPAMIFILSLVFAAISVMLEQGDSSHPGYLIFEYVTFTIFATELTVRMIAVGNMVTFFADPFGVIDFVVVALDLLMLSNALTSLGGETKALRIIRMLRLVRAFRMVKLAIKIREEMRRPKAVVPWVLQDRFVRSSKAKLAGLTGMLGVLLRIDAILGKHRFAMLIASLKQEHVRMLALAGRGRGVWDAEADASPAVPMDQALALISDARGVSLNAHGIDITGLLFNTIMYEWPPLVQNSIQLLMVHHEATGAMVDSLQKFQMVSNFDDEKLHATIIREVRELRDLAETYELWRELVTPTAVATGLRCVEVLVHLRAIILEPEPRWLGGGLQFRTRGKVQVMLRNLGFFEVSLLVRTAIPLGSGRKGPAADLARGIFLLNNDLLCWFMHQNPDNQMMVFRQLPIFIDDITCNVGSTAVIMEMVRDNNEIIKMVPQSLFDALVRWLELQPQDDADPASVELLRLLVRCQGIVLAENQLRVFKLMMTPGVIGKLFTCKEVGGADYNKRERMMQQAGKVLTGEDSSSYSSLADAFTAVRQQSTPAVADTAVLDVLVAASSARVGVNTAYFYMPRQLQFHVQVLKLMATCAGGRINIIEAKIQTMFPLHTLLDAIIADDASNMLADVRMPLTNLIFEAFVDVQVPCQAMCTNPQLWDLLESFPAAIIRAVDLLRREEGNATRREHGVLQSAADGPDCGRAMRSTVRHVLDEVMPFVHDFIEIHFNRRNILKQETRSDEQIDAFLQSTHIATRRLYELQPACMSDEQAHSTYVALRMLARSINQPPPAFIPRGDSADVADGEVGGGSRSVETAGKLDKSDLADEFVAGMLACTKDAGAVALTRQGMRDCAARIKGLPRLSDPVTDAIRYEPLLSKMIRHAQGLVNVEADRKTLAREHQPSMLWILELFRTMVEDEWGFSVTERDEDGDETSDAKAWPVQQSLTDCGACELCINLIANGIDRSVVFEAMTLLVTLLFREGGALHVQKAMNAHLLGSDTSGMFFDKINDMLMEILHWSELCDQNNTQRVKDAEKRRAAQLGGDDGGAKAAAGGDDDEEDDDDDEPVTPDMTVMQLMQLMCEGHYGPNQGIVKEQPSNEVSFNLLDRMVEIVTTFSPIKSRSSTAVISTTCELILEVLQGPCVQNQEHFALETELMEALNMLLCATDPVGDSDQDGEEEEECRTTICKIFKAITECQKKPSLVFERLMSAVHAESLTRHLRVPPPPVPLDTIKDEIERAEAVDAHLKLQQAPLSEMQVECLVLIQMMCDYAPEFPKEVNLPASLVAKMGTEVVSVEIVWNGELQRRFFHVPQMCKQLASASRDELVTQVNRENQDLKLQDFIRRSKVVMCELMHQDQLREMGIDKVFNRNVQNTMTWISFYINVCINAVSVQFLSMPAGDYDQGTSTYAMGAPVLSNDMADTVQAFLNYTQITLASFTLVLYLIVRSPVVYKNALADEGTSPFSAFLEVVHPFKGLTPYYFVYVVFAVMGMDMPIFNALLLFDILIKNSTSRDVLLAVTKPAKQIAATALLLLIVIYVSAFMYFMLYRNHFDMHECDTLGACFRLCITYGLRYGGGVGDYLTDVDSNSDIVVQRAVDMGSNNEGTRFWLDVMFFIIVIIILLNIIFGIIIDNFAEVQNAPLYPVSTALLHCSLHELADKTPKRLKSNSILTTHSSLRCTPCCSCATRKRRG